MAVLDGKLVDTYNGERTAAAIGKWGLSTANKQLAQRLSGGGGSSQGAGSKGAAAAEPGGGKAVVKLSGASFDTKVTGNKAPVMVEFYAPWCGHCKQVRWVGAWMDGVHAHAHACRLTTHVPPPSQLAPNWAKAAEELAPRGLTLGAVDCTAEEQLCARFEVKGYPHIMVFGRDKAKPRVYDGPRSASDIVSFGLKLLETDGLPPEVSQLLSGEQFASECTAAGRQACVLAFLPAIIDTTAAARTRSLDTLGKGAGAFASRPWGWAWLEAGSQPALEASLGVSQYPSVVMLNAKKGVASRMRAALSDANLKEFLNVVPHAEPVTLPDAGALATSQPWDGKDAPPPQVEDEIPLDEL